jgi:hypothetical protein
MLRYYLQNHDIPNIGRIVMLAPGNEGSPFLSLFNHHPLYTSILGPAGVQSASNDECFACTLVDDNLPETGIISGCVALNPLSFLSMPWPHDGMITVQGTRLKAMKDHIVLPVSHDSMLSSPAALYQTVHFIRHGHFNHVS